MRDLLLNVLAAASLLLCIAATALGVRGYWIQDWWEQRNGDQSLLAWLEAGSLFVERERAEPPPASRLDVLPLEIREALLEDVLQEPAASGRHVERKHSFRSRHADDPSDVTARLRDRAASDPGTIRDWHFFGFHCFVTEGGATYDGRWTSVARPGWRLGVPLWAVAVVFSLLPLVRIRSLVRTRDQRRRQREGKCPACGYDLRVSPERCPECGEVLPPSRSQVPDRQV